jgi:deoxyribodipyrimidine photo-lyase
VSGGNPPAADLAAARTLIEECGYWRRKEELEDVEKAISELHIDRSVKRVDAFHGGTKEAKSHLGVFLESKLDRFPELRNDPTLDYLSHMSPYLHFGQISPLYIALKVSKTGSPGIEAFLEELIIRRELSMNFVFYNEKYDSIDSIPNWAKKTLRTHQKDRRPFLYSFQEFENARTHDPYWNAAQREMALTGKMHGYFGNFGVMVRAYTYMRVQGKEGLRAVADKQDER